MDTPIDSSCSSGSSIAQGGAQGNGAFYPERRSESRVEMSVCENSQLTERQSEVLKYVAEGLPKKAIASRLAIHLSTVNRHIEAVYERLGAHNATHAVVVAMCRGILAAKDSAPKLAVFALVGALSYQMITAIDNGYLRPRNNRRTNTTRVTSAKTRTEYSA